MTIAVNKANWILNLTNRDRFMCRWIYLIYGLFERGTVSFYKKQSDYESNQLGTKRNSYNTLNFFH